MTDLHEWERALLERKAAEPEWSAPIEAVGRTVSMAVAAALHEELLPADRDFAAEMVLIAHERGMAKARLDAALERARRAR